MIESEEVKVRYVRNCSATKLGSILVAVDPFTSLQLQFNHPRGRTRANDAFLKQSYFETDGSSGRFYGDLDIDTLGGAGFASQRTTGEDRNWDLSDYHGIKLNVDKADGTIFSACAHTGMLNWPRQKVHTHPQGLTPPAEPRQWP